MAGGSSHCPPLCRAGVFLRPSVIIDTDKEDVPSILRHLGGVITVLYLGDCRIGSMVIFQLDNKGRLLDTWTGDKNTFRQV